jgi:hypothetical protein
MEYIYMKTGKIILIALFGLTLVVSAQTRKEEVTLVMVPREEPAMQIGLDIFSRYPTLLISYLTTANGTISLHGWTGTQWVNIKVESFKSGIFFKNGPNSALLVEGVNMALSEDLIPSIEWCEEVSKITTTEPRPLLHLIGQYYDFNFKDWQWFSKRYNQPITAINPEGLNISWYHKRLNEHFQATGPQGASDLQYWVSIRQAMTFEEPEVEEMDLVIVEEETLEEHENPLTNSVPSAVILGAGDVPEEQAEESLPEVEVVEEVVEESDAM